MVTHLMRSLVERTRHRLRRPEAEAGSLILDILIGMAIFALIAIIAVSAIGQYRMRAYTQAAMSDAEQVATAIAGHVTDNVTKTDAGTYPTGLLDAAALKTLDVSVTTSGPEASKVTVTPAETDPERFTVCVEHRGAFAVYDSDAGLTASGDAERENFDGCATDPGNGGGTGGGGGGETEQPALAAPSDLSVTSQSAQRRLVASWAAVPDATTYTVYLDGSPAWTGPTTEATLENVGPGDHTVTVTATDASRVSLPSESAVATIERNNDFYREAHALSFAAPGESTLSGDYDNTNATTEATEYGQKTASLWWTITPPKTGTYTFTMVPDSSGQLMSTYSGYWNVFNYNGPDTMPTGADYVAGQAASRPSALLRLEGGRTYWLRKSAQAGLAGTFGSFRVQVTTPPNSDDLADADVVAPYIGSDGTWRSANVDNRWATSENASRDPGKSLWWTFTPTEPGIYTVQAIPTTNNDPITPNVLFVKGYETSGTSVAGLPAQMDGSGGTTPLRFEGRAGITYKFAISTSAAYQDGTKFRLSVYRDAE